MSLNPESQVVRAAVVMNCVYDSTLKLCVLTLKLEGQILKLQIHPETAKTFYPGRTVNLKLVVQ